MLVGVVCDVVFVVWKGGSGGDASIEGSRIYGSRACTGLLAVSCTIIVVEEESATSLEGQNSVTGDLVSRHRVLNRCGVGTGT